MRIKSYVKAVASILLLFPLLFGYSSEGMAATTTVHEGKLSSKDEVIYATMHANGTLRDIYVVNTLDVTEAGMIEDFGEYTQLRNLTDTSGLKQKGERVQLQAPKGKFYYQGNMKEQTELPWNINVSYFLDGVKMEPAQLSGATGHLKLEISTSRNEQVDSIFYDNYLLQISLDLSNSYRQIESDSGMIANAGKNKSVTFTIMPGEEGKGSVESDVTNFAFDGIQIAAVPSSLPIDTSKMEGMTDDMATLSDAIQELNKGIATLKSGVAQLNNGSNSLKSGSLQYKNGMQELNASSQQIMSGSASINKALERMKTALSAGNSNMDLSSLNELPKGLRGLSSGVSETALGLSTLQRNYAQAYQALDAAMTSIPSETITEENIAALYRSGADAQVIDKLVSTYRATLQVKGTYAAVKEAFAAVVPALNQSSSGLNTISSTLTTMADSLEASLKNTNVSGLSQLQTGLTELSSQYGKFHAGLANYTQGVSTLTNSYNKLHGGIGELTNGVGKLSSGVNELQNGSSKLAEETKNLPGQMKNKIHEMVAEYDKSDFQPVSFVSSKNEKVYSVQFVMKTESIEQKEDGTKTQKPKKEKGFFQLFLDLFKKD